MIRVLIMIAVAGFAVSVVTLSTAVGLAGPDAVLHGAWTWSSEGWGHGDGFHHRTLRSDEGPQLTRQIGWTGGDAITFNLPADVRYTQGAGPMRITLTGPQDAVNDVELKDGVLRYKDDHEEAPHLGVVVTAPAITRFEMDGSGRLEIGNYHQDVLKLQLDGDADVVAAGETKAVELTILGSADADLKALKTETAKVDIEGSGDAALAPARAADVNISGSGDVTLLTHPSKLQSNISGSGRLRQKDGVTNR